jgi:hypothetical protein
MSKSPAPETTGATARPVGERSATDDPTGSDPDAWLPPPPDPTLPGGDIMGGHLRASPAESRIERRRETAWSDPADQPDEPMPAPSGFVLVEEYGRGGMGVVYLA